MSNSEPSAIVLQCIPGMGGYYTLWQEKSDDLRAFWQVAGIEHGYLVSRKLPVRNLAGIQFRS